MAPSYFSPSPHFPPILKANTPSPGNPVFLALIPPLRALLDPRKPPLASDARPPRRSAGHPIPAAF